MEPKLTKTWYTGAAGLMLLALGIMFMSIWRQIDKQVERSLTGSGSATQILNASGSSQLNLAELASHESLPKLKYLPHHPVYLARMVYQRVRLWLTFEDLEKVRLLLDYADQRVGVSAQLLSQGKGREAIEAAAKGYMYDLQVADILRQHQSDEAKALWVHLAGAVAIHERTVIDLEAAVVDNFKPKVNVLVMGLETLRQETKIRAGINGGN
jgi:hypothetical protein